MNSIKGQKHENNNKFISKSAKSLYVKDAYVTHP